MRHTAQGWWLADAGPVEPLAPLEHDVDADVVVVGGGYTGMWTAWHLGRLEPEARVVLLEAGICGTGPSGLNRALSSGEQSQVGGACVVT